MKESIVTKTIIYGALILGAFVPVVPTEIQNAEWERVYQIEAYDTDDGLLSPTQYFEESDGTFKVRGEEGFPVTVDSLTIEHKEKVNRLADKSLYLNEYRKFLDENVYVVLTDDDPKYEYEKLKRSEVDEPKIKERQSLIDLMVDPLPIEAFTPDRYSSNTWSVAAQTVTFSHIISSGDVLIMVIGTNDATPNVVQSATYDSVSMTMETSFATSTDSLYAFYLSSPTVGTNNIFVDLDVGTGSADRGYIKAFSLSGADTSDPIELTQTAYGTGTTTQTITHTAGNIGIDITNSRDASIVNNINTLEGSSLTFFDSGSITFYSNEYIKKYTSTKTKSVNAQEGTPTAMAWKNDDGTKFWISGTVNDTVFEYSCSTGWDPSSCTYSSVSFSISAEDVSSQDIAWGNSGAKFYMVGSTNDRIFQYSCSTSYLVSSCSYDSVSTSTPLGEASPESITWHPDGDRFWIAGTSLDQAREYTLTTPWDISTAATTTKTLSLGNNPADFEFSSDGYYAYSIAPATDVRQFFCTTAYDLTTCTQIKEVIPRSFAIIEPNTGEAMTFKDINTVFLIGTTNDTIYTYELNTSTTTTTMGVNNGAGNEMWATIGVIIRKASAPATGGIIDSGIIWYNQD